MKRYRTVYVIVAIFCVLALYRLVDLQIVNGDDYRNQSEQRLLKTSPIKAPRGSILDRKGRVLVEDKTGFSIQIHYVLDQTSEERNELLLRLYRMVLEDGGKVTDSFPVTYEPYTFIFGDDADGTKQAEWKKNNNIIQDMTASEVIKHYKGLYQITDRYSSLDARTIIGIRYEMERTGYSSKTSFTFADGISDLLVTKIKEQGLDLPGVVITTTPSREFVNEKTAAHILGRVGKIYKEEYEELKKKNYSMNDVIGKQGLEKYLESTLRGKDGLSGVEQSLDGKQVKVIETEEPIAGNNVVLTIDLDVQKAAEKSLEDTINYIREAGPKSDGKGYDADCGAIVAIDVKSGEILALASYPTYNPSTFNEDYNNLITDKTVPMLNRAIGGVYAPGSTFKMLTAISALEEGTITPTDIIVDQGVYKYFNDYRPACWIWNSSHGTHGALNVAGALKNSCNYFFYDIGRRVTIEKMNKYGTLLGLGQSTGIELSSEENMGKLAGPEDRRKNGKSWMPGDTLQAAIGQSDNLFSPLQIANYLATIVNGGTRYKAHLVKAVRSSSTGEVISETKSEILSSLNFKEENYKVVMEGMRDVIENGTASDVFRGFNVSVGGKTGTAEVPGGSDNATFVGFAPYDDPSIAVCAVIEHGAHGSYTGRAVRNVLDAYFNSEIEPDTVNIKNTLMR